MTSDKDYQFRMINLVFKYFPGLTASQRKQIEMLLLLYTEWNSKINVISRKDVEHLYLHHVLHSLAIAKIIQFIPGTKVLDVGTGGGFPGIPLAIMFPETSFCLIDSTGKKIKVVKAVAEALNLNNVAALQVRAEDVQEKYDFILSRAVAALPEFYSWTAKNINKKSQNKIPNGILYLKGGDITGELKNINAGHHEYSISEFFEENYFQEKYVVHIYPH